MADQEVALMAHLMRRAAFGASRDEIEARAAQGYDKTVEELLTPNNQPGVEEDLMFRLQPSFYQAAAIEVNVQQWVYRMINDPSPAPGKDGAVLARDLLCRPQQRSTAAGKWARWLPCSGKTAWATSGTSFTSFPPTQG